jgi:hypothetical protein
VVRSGRATLRLGPRMIAVQRTGKARAIVERKGAQRRLSRLSQELADADDQTSSATSGWRWRKRSM